MALPADYITGTITLTNGSTAFTGTDTGWLAADFREGDTIPYIAGGESFAPPIVATITSNTAGTLTTPWAGPTLTGVAYRMRYQWDSSRVSAQTRTMIEQLGNGNLQSISALTGPGVLVFDGPHSTVVKPETDFINGVAYDVQVDTLADRAAYDGQTEGFAVLVSDVGDGRSAIYSKNSNSVGDWSDPAYVTGPVGPSPGFAAGTTTTVPPGTPADVDLVPDGSGGYLFDFDIPAGEGFTFRGAYSGATAYVLGDVVRNNNSSWIALQATTGNAPPVLPTTVNAYWELLAAAGVNGTGTVTSIVPGAGISVDNTDPENPVVSAIMRESVLQGANIYQITGSLKHKGLTVQIFPTTETVTTASQGNKKWVIVWREGVAHGYDGTSVMKAADSYDQGRSLQNIRTIYNETAIDARDFSGAIMDGGRIGLITTREAGVSTFERPMFLYSDNNGVTWTSVILTGSYSGLSFDEYLHNIPVALGGGAQSWIAYGWINPTRDSIVYARTDDNGATWSYGTAVGVVSGEDWSEPRVARLGNTNRWVMVIRRNQSDGLNALITTSPDLINWSVPVDSGQQAGRNCMTLLQTGDDLNWFVFSRSYAEAAMAIGDFRDGLLVQSRPIDEVWASPASWPGWSMFASMFRPLGYLKFVEDSGKIYGSFAYNEREVGDNASYSALAILTNDPAFSQLGAMSGADANGTWIAYPDGRLECQGLLTLTGLTTSPYGSIFLSTSVSIAYPSNPAIQFAYPPVVTADVDSSSERGWITGSGNPGDKRLTFNFEIVTPVNIVSSTLTVMYQAKGFWS